MFSRAFENRRSLMGQKRRSAFSVILSSHIALIMFFFFFSLFSNPFSICIYLSVFPSNAEDSIEDEIEMRKRAGINDNWAVLLKAGQMKCPFCFHPVRYDAFITHRVGKILTELFPKCASYSDRLPLRLFVGSKAMCFTKQ